MYTIERKTGGATVKKTLDEKLREELNSLKKGTRLERELRGCVTCTEYFDKLRESLMSLHKDENIQSAY